jgi:DNA primase
MGFCDSEIAEWFSSNLPKNWELDPSYVKSSLENCVILPIRDDCKRVVAVAARNPEAKKGWWNTPFVKEACLYGLHEARTAAYARNKLYLVEGYADTLTLRQEGLPNVAGLMSTTLSANAVAVILRYCDRICACFDADPPVNGKPGAGKTALVNLVREYNKPYYFQRLYAVPLSLRQNEKGELLKDDPDSFVKRNGLGAFLELEKSISKD